MRWVGPSTPQQVTVTGEPQEPSGMLSQYGEAYTSMNHAELEKLERLAIDNAQRILNVRKSIEIADHPYSNGHLLVKGG